MKKRSIIYKILRFILNIFYRKREFIGLENLPSEPCIIVGNHAQIHGPIIAEVQFPVNKKTWCTNNVLDKKEFVNHAKTDFWGLKPKWIKWFFDILAHIIAPIGVSVFNSADVISVYKDNRLKNTYKQTIRELQKGNNIIIFPECPTPYNNIVNEFQENYIDVARLYYRLTEKCVSFVPMYIAVRIKKVLFGKPINYNPNIPIEEMRKTINTYLKNEITNLALSLPAHKVVHYSNTGRKNNPLSK